MNRRRETDERAESRFVSTGQLPPQELVPALLSLAHELYGSNTEGATSHVYPALARVPGDLFGICVVGTNGDLYTAGDAEVEFTIMSVSKPFVFALVCEALGPDGARDTLGVNATGLPFNSLTAIEQSADGRTNPMVNPGRSPRRAWCPARPPRPSGGSSTMGCPASPAGRCRSTTTCTRPLRRRNQRNQRHRAAAPEPTAESPATRPTPPTSTRGSAALNVTARDLAVMGATLADGGVNPAHPRARGRRRDLPARAGRDGDRGLYETSGDWLYDVGLPGKSGIGGGIVTVAPGKGGLGTFAPPLDAPATASRASS